eukprot:TRINITY_DN28836_c0_g1_i1.p1 TRINITY_DN28836_c0_g1~~TRINITY_DN28836_c0_g1_i1.p1  ORF type:complete len:651 (+),score=78.48 TRINITY_DN28836_c0_g1_i1:48-2000(+)
MSVVPVKEAGPPTRARGGGRARNAKVKNMAPAAIQITAEQLLREAKDRQEPDVFHAPKQKIKDPDELRAFQLRKRKEFEDAIRRSRNNVSHWYKYAKWEEEQLDYERCRSIYERALDVDPRSGTMWQRYAEMEMRNKFVNFARNVWDRAVKLLPRVDNLWLKWTHMEETLGNITGCREVYRRWMLTKPPENAWRCFAKFELRYNEKDNARAVIKQFVQTHNIVTTWLYYAKFEEKIGEPALARAVYEAAIPSLGEYFIDENFFMAFAKFEERQKEFDRARAIYKYALDRIPKGNAPDLYHQFTSFEKQYGDIKGIEDVVVSRKRFEYEQELQVNPHNYDVWFDYIRLEENNADSEKCREVFERAISNVPKVKEKRYWERYIYLWIMYAVYEELDEQDMERTREVYEAVLKLVPHRKFTFAKLWVMYAHFEIRQDNLPKARKILGAAIGKAPKDSLFRNYIDLEIQLGNLSRVRTLYQKWLEWNPTNTTGWIKFATLETSLEEIKRARAIYDMAANQPVLDMPEMLWKEYIDFEINNGENQKAQQLYTQLIEKTHHFKVYIAYAMFQATTCEDVKAARAVFEDGHEMLNSDPDLKDELGILLENWQQFEEDYGDAETQKELNYKIHPETRPSGLSKILAAARARKKAKVAE